MFARNAKDRYRSDVDSGSDLANRGTAGSRRIKIARGIEGFVDVSVRRAKEQAGGGRKPYRQKGTGRARQGSIRSPQFRGGGVVFGPHPRSYVQRLPRQMKRLALVGALTSKLDDDAIRVVDGFGLEGPKTRDIVNIIDALNCPKGRVLIVAPATDETLILSARNVPGVEVIRADSLNVVAVLNADMVLIEQPALSRMEEVYA